MVKVEESVKVMDGKEKRREEMEEVYEGEKDI